MFIKKIIKIWLVCQIAAIVLTLFKLNAEDDYQFNILVKLSERKLYLLEGKENSNIKTYVVAVPKHNYYGTITGELTRIEIDPFWYPTAKTQAAYFKKQGKELPRVVRPFKEDKRNAMGAVKFVIKFEQLSEPIRIHGTNEPESIGKKITRGCIRLYNEDILELVSIIKDARTKVIIKD